MIDEEFLMSGICKMRVINNRILLKYVDLTRFILVFAMIFMTQPISAQASDPPAGNGSPDQVISKMKERLKLTEEQETKIRPIIEESMRARTEILENFAQDKSTMKSELLELQWKTDMRLGVILTEEQMKEYEKLREEQSEKMPGKQNGGGSHSGRSRGF